MKKLILIGLLFPHVLSAQFIDDFSDNDFSNNPAWQGDDANYEVLDSVLHLNGAPVADESYLSTSCQAINNALWEFFLKMDFNPSSTNYAKIYLVSDRADLENNLQGYFVKIGNTTDEISLYRQTGSTETEIIDGMDGRVNTDPVTVRIRVSRDAAGTWILWSDTTGGNNYSVEGTVIDDTYFASQFFGISCTYTSTRSTLFYFDDFNVSGTPFVDTIRPAVDTVVVLTSSMLSIQFSETVEKTSAENALNYSASNGIGIPVTAIRDAIDSARVILTFSNLFQNALLNTITISNVADLNGNAMVQESIDFIYLSFGTPDYHDVIITEIFPDPDPAVALPAAEFVEIFNRSSDVLNLNGWTLSDAGSSATLGYEVLLPGEYVILCPSASENAYQSFGKTMGLSLPSLNNDADELTLKDAFGNLIFNIRYTDDWYRDNLKKNGGWSLEMMDTTHPCSGADNWRASNNVSGGTPGKINSVNAANPDESAPSLINVLVVDSMNVLLNFDESLDRTTAIIPANFSIDNGISVVAASFTNTAYSQIQLIFSTILQQKVIYTLTLNGVTDCSGNGIGVNDSAQFGLAEKPGSLDIVINEILSNPVSGGSDFIELYNRSAKIIDLEDIFIASIDEEDSDTSVTVIAANGFLLLPGNYAALTSDAEHITTQYFTPNPKGVLNVPGMPSFDDDEDVVVLFNRLDNNSVIDAVHYYSDWNFALLDDLNGVSLERINYNAASQNHNNWHSAASTVGYATPAYQNSQFGESSSVTSALSIEPKTFSPNNDGYEDVLNIHYKLEQPGFVANIRIYDDSGRKIRELAINVLLETEGNIIWDGVNDDGEKARIGVYIIVADLFNLSGEKKKFKESCVLSGKL